MRFVLISVPTIILLGRERVEDNPWADMRSSHDWPKQETRALSHAPKPLQTGRLDGGKGRV